VAERAWFGLRTASIFAVCGNQTAKRLYNCDFAAPPRRPPLPWWYAVFPLW
jgi:hypothetical protein